MFAINYHVHWISGRANFLSKYIIYIFFNFGRGCCGSFPMLFPKTPASCYKRFWTYFCCILFLCLSPQKVCLRLLKFYFRLSFFVSFLVDIFNKKAPSLTKKTSAVKSKTRFVLLTRLNATPVVTLFFNPSHPKRSYRKLRRQNTKGKFHHWQKLELCKFIHIAKLHKKC